MSKFCIQPKLYLKPEEHHQAHSNDGESAALCSAAMSNTFLGIVRPSTIHSMSA